MDICEKFSENTLATMLEILGSSLRQGKEMGAIIKDDYSLGEKVKGEAHSITIDRTGSIGAYHVHPFQSVAMSDADIIEMAKFDSQVECIGAEVEKQRRVSCYIPSDVLEFSFFFRPKVKTLMGEINAFNTELKTKYPDGKPKTEMEWGMARALVRRRNNLGQEIEAHKDKLLSRCNLK